MYHYLDDNDSLRSMRQQAGKIMQEFCHILKEEYDIGASFFLVGSGAKNLILRNESQPVDLDYNLKIVRCEDWEDCRTIKECARKAFNKALRKYNLPDCEDSTSSLTTKKMYVYVSDMFSPVYSIDVCIVFTDSKGSMFRLIHKKTGIIRCDEYYWSQAPSSREIQKKVRYIKSNGKWDAVRQQYKNIKNKY